MTEVVMGRGWTEERKAAHGEKMRRHWAARKAEAVVDPDIAAARAAAGLDPQTGAPEGATLLETVLEPVLEQGFRDPEGVTITPDRFDMDSAAAILRKMVYRVAARLGSGHFSREYCDLCESSGVHALKFRRCTCPCHEAWAFLNWQDKRDG
jgi:hypothetical protein